MNNVVPLRAGKMPAVFASRQDLPDMNAAAQQGLLASFAVIGYKGRNWRIKYRGDEELLKDQRGAPIPTLDVVLVGISPAISKQWYDKRYSEGDQEAPDCHSIDGIVPEADSPKKQCESCAACPQNVFGSRITEAGKKAKACQDSRRLAVVPAGDIANEGYGGPMLLRIPPMSLANLAKYTGELERFGAQPYMVRTVLAFDYDVAYPLINFQAEGWLSDEEAEEVATALDDPLIKRMLETEQGEAAPASPLASGGPAKAFKAAAAPAPEPTPEPEPEPEPAPVAAKPATTVAAVAAKPATTVAAAPAKRASAFAAKTPPVAVVNKVAPKRVAAPAPAAQAAAQAAAGEEGAGEGDETAPGGAVEVAPDDLQGAIDSLLAG